MSFWTVGELRSEGNAQADLAGAAGDDVRHDAVDANGGEDEREHAEAAERDGGDAERATCPSDR